MLIMSAHERDRAHMSDLTHLVLWTLTHFQPTRPGSHVQLLKKNDYNEYSAE